MTIKPTKFRITACGPIRYQVEGLFHDEWRLTGFYTDNRRHITAVHPEALGYYIKEEGERFMSSFASVEDARRAVAEYRFQESRDFVIDC